VCWTVWAMTEIGSYMMQWLLLGTQLGVKLDGNPRAAAWCERCAERPACKRAR
jgi:hypothetical protein